MGIVARQSAKNSTVLGVGVIVGAISSLFIYPLDLAFVGNIRVMIGAAGLLAPLAGLGIAALSVKFHSEFATGSKDDRGFFGLLLLMLLCASLIFIAVYLAFDEEIIHLFTSLNKNFAKLGEDKLIILVLVVTASFIGISQRYLSNFQRVVVPSLLNGLLEKIIIPALVLGSYYAIASTTELKALFVVSKVIILALMFAYVANLRKLHLKIDWSFLRLERIKRMSNFSLFALLGSLGSMIAFQIDTVMIGGMLGYTEAGIYTIALFIANVMIIPNKSIGPLVGAQIAAGFHDNDLEKVSQLYTKSALTLLVLGLGALLLIWCNLEDVLSFATNTEELMRGAQVVLLIGVAKLFDMVTGLNTHIIQYSKYYKWNLVFTLIMGTTSILANIYFIPREGITGAAIATLISLTLFNVLKQIFLWSRFRMQPFTLATLKVCLLGVVTSLVIWIIPSTGSHLLNLFLQTALVGLLFGLPVHLLRLSPDISNMIDKYWSILSERLA